VCDPCKVNRTQVGRKLRPIPKTTRPGPSFPFDTTLCVDQRSCEIHTLQWTEMPLCFRDCLTRITVILIRTRKSRLLRVCWIEKKTRGVDRRSDPITFKNTLSSTLRLTVLSSTAEVLFVVRMMMMMSWWRLTMSTLIYEKFWQWHGYHTENICKAHNASNHWNLVARRLWLGGQHWSAIYSGYRREKQIYQWPGEVLSQEIICFKKSTKIYKDPKYV